MGSYVDAEGWMAIPTGYGRRAYQAYVPHPLRSLSLSLDTDTVNAFAAADRALVTIASLPGTPLGTAIADWMIARDESVHSSIIEGVAATEEGLAWARYMDQVGRPVSDENDALTLGAAKQVAAAVALGQRMRAGDACTPEDICDIHRCLFEGTRDRIIGGVTRDGPIWIGPRDCLVDEATFVAPPHEAVPALMDDLVAYLNSDAHPAALQAAIAHAQFETIHPFNDGNGRTGRALIHTVLNARGSARGAVPLSTALDNDLRGYYAALNATHVVCDADDSTTRSAGLQQWLTVFCRACEDAQRQAASVVRTVEAMAARWRASTSFRSNSAASKLLEALPSMPVLDAELVAERLGITAKAARSAIGALTRAQILRPSGGRRNQRYTVPELVDLVRGMAPDGGPPPAQGATSSLLTETGSAQEPSPPPLLHRRVECGQRGPRTKRDCVLPKGHRGQHRYH